MITHPKPEQLIKQVVQPVLLMIYVIALDTFYIVSEL